MTTAHDELWNKVASKIADVKKLYDDGYTRVKFVRRDAGGKVVSSEMYRLFHNHDTMFYFRKNSRRYGYHLDREILARWLDTDEETVTISGFGKSPKTLSTKEKFLLNLKKFKMAFLDNAHENAWSDLVYGYGKLDVNEFASRTPDNATWSDMWKELHEYCGDKAISLITENSYKTTTIKSNPPMWHGRKYENDVQYQTCIANIQKHFDNMEEFHYHWQGNYDVTVEGKLRGDGVYRTYLSLEYKGCGNGHYYLLINPNTAVFAEND